MTLTDRTDDELTKLFIETGFDLSAFPVVGDTKDVARLFNTSDDAVVQRRKRGSGPPWVRHGRTVKYLRTDVARYLLANRTDPQTVA